MLRLSEVTLRRGPRTLLERASMNVHPGQKVGLVGPNGSGKSSLFALVRGEVHADAGEVTMPPRWKLAHLAQETPALERPALEFVLDADVELREVEAAIASQHHEGTLLAELHARFEEIGGYSARSRAQALLGGLGFGPGTHERPVAEFSGGWRVRLNLARSLMARSDLLLLDEPTNHLDLDAVLWLEDWLKSFDGAVLLVTHDREFLDAVAGQIVTIEARRLVAYAGNYSAFEAQRAERLAHHQAAFEKQQKTIAHLEAFITRFRAKATKARQAQSRIRALEKLERIAAAHVDRPFEFAIEAPARMPRPLFRLDAAAVGYGDKAVLSGIEWSVMPGETIGLLGPNGAGKSTLIKSIVGELPLVAGRAQRSPDLRPGYFAQHQVDALRLEDSALGHVARLAPGEREQRLRDFLGGFDLGGDHATRPVATFSGGEKARLALALIVWAKPNLLLLDEPTNHLDIEMREALAEALTGYTGALILVAHDRHLLASATDQWMLVADGAVRPFDGGLDDYKAWARTRQAASQKPARETSRKDERRAEAIERQRRSQERKPLEKRVGAIEAELAALGAEASAADAWLAAGEAYAEEARERLEATLKRRAEVARAIEDLELEWLRLNAALDER